MRKAQARGLEPAHIWQRNGASARAAYPANTGVDFACTSVPFVLLDQFMSNVVSILQYVIQYVQNRRIFYSTFVILTLTTQTF